LACLILFTSKQYLRTLNVVIYYILLEKANKSISLAWIFLFNSKYNTFKMSGLERMWCHPMENLEIWNWHWTKWNGYWEQCNKGIEGKFTLQNVVIGMFIDELYWVWDESKRNSRFPQNSVSFLFGIMLMHSSWFGQSSAF
jgi:hypothetical protein